MEGKKEKNKDKEKKWPKQSQVIHGRPRAQNTYKGEGGWSMQKEPSWQSWIKKETG